MSAFIVSDKHLNYLVSYALEKAMISSQEEAQQYVDCLFKANVHSYNYRYNAKEDDSNPPVFERVNPVFEPIQVLKACKCLRYQSCEDSEEWEGSDAENIVEAIKSRAENDLPGYNDAEWEIK